jgi:hypothetical protein
MPPQRRIYADIDQQAEEFQAQLSPALLAGTGFV